MDVEKAIEFVRMRGNELDRARLSHALGEDFNTDEIIDGFSRIQNPDGGFPYGDRKGFPSCLSNTAMALHVLLELNLVDSEPAGRAIDFFQGMRKDNGTWEENPKIMPLDPPFWDMPGDDDTTIWITADIADVMQRAGRNVTNETLAFLKSQQEADGRFKGYYHTTWIALSLFGKNGLADDKVFSRALAYLESVDLNDWDISCVAWCLDCMNRGGVGKDAPLRTRLMYLILDTQEQDGSWPSDGGEQLKIRDSIAVLNAVLDIILK
ncbi:MAG: terpene cyclase/mutase family protein [Candidatus Thermoplasmatota archaeon]|nr:terpene cyclase/mutase family protein [Euryarchaeota archaeon]MBU4032425.1 terpene cyclase/mutase family protein [Candidatus Thermoplasmatota archaeon]MBU4071142.1 terpene cyclase/mutase family protein [Candidatus Thermoplasmatota archaeon]MBU4143759.1 terpene cyclase/mutase family protein [Candidatus Thermoplasmatota archaeon]MBU4591407.1 terpene cyclase/mutase family protein [Candidatus Thermoplasmatota archaeon]